MSKQVITKKLQLNNVPIGLDSDQHLVIGSDKVVKKVADNSVKTVNGIAPVNGNVTIESGSSNTSNLQDVLNAGASANSSIYIYSGDNWNSIYAGSSVVADYSINKDTRMYPESIQFTQDFPSGRQGLNRILGNLQDNTFCNFYLPVKPSGTYDLATLNDIPITVDNWANIPLTLLELNNAYPNAVIGSKVYAAQLNRIYEKISTGWIWTATNFVE